VILRCHLEWLAYPTVVAEQVVAMCIARFPKPSSNGFPIVRAADKLENDIQRVFTALSAVDRAPSSLVLFAERRFWSTFKLQPPQKALK